MNWENNTRKYVTAFVVLLLVLNPETAQLAFFIDAVGLEMILLLFEIQLLAIGIFLYGRTIKPLLTWVGITLHPLWQTGSNIKRNPKTLVLMVPSQAAVMHMLVLSAGIAVACNTI